MQWIAERRGVGGTAMRRGHFLLLYAAMLLAASGNTAVQSVMPAIGRAMAIPDVFTAIAYTVSAVLWVVLAPMWARASDRHGRKALTLLGVGGFVVSTLLCGLALEAGLSGLVGGIAAFVLFGIARGIYGALGSATPSATQAYLASRTRRSARVAALSALASSFGLGTIIGPAMAPLFVLPFVGLPGPFFGFAIIGLGVWLAIWRWLPDDTRPRRGRRSGHGAAMSYPSIATPTTGASVVAATAPRGLQPMRWTDRRIRRWIVAGVAAGHAQAAVLTYLGFLVIDRLALAPVGSEGPIAIVLMAGATATLAAQWGIIPRLAIGPRALVAGGALIAALGFAVLAAAADLYGLVVGFALASLGFGLTRPGFTGGASLAVSLAEQGAIAGIITAANGISYVAAPTLAMLIYALDPDLPSLLCAGGLVILAIWAWRRL
ncbi:MFS transporter [Sphingomonas mesophila]|uniref:MFS transporter n=1 Tax=Sphingomonas mesophila TaxID=2303576 RepID=UPI001F07A73D|nr:MFS transporter [Sphingomonas mesophila]